MRSRLRYRSPVRVLTWTPIGLLFIVAGVGATKAEEPPALIFAALGAVVLMYAWWPRLVISREGVEVRNLTVTRLAWRDVAGVSMNSQLPYLGRTMRVIHALAQARTFGIGDQGYPGVVINTHSLGPVAVAAAQRSVVSGRPGYAERVGEDLLVARQAVAKRLDPINAVLEARAARRTVSSED